MSKQPGIVARQRARRRCHEATKLAMALTASRTRVQASAPPRRCGSLSKQNYCGVAGDAVFDVVASALDASPGAARCALDVSPDAARCALDASPDVVAACRLAERHPLRSAAWGACSAPGPRRWIPLAPWAEPPRPTWRVPEWKKAFGGKEFPFEFFRSCRDVLFCFSAANRCPEAA